MNHLEQIEDLNKKLDLATFALNWYAKENNWEPSGISTIKELKDMWLGNSSHGFSLAKKTMEEIDEINNRAHARAVTESLARENEYFRATMDQPNDFTTEGDTGD